MEISIDRERGNSFPFFVNQKLKEILIEAHGGSDSTVIKRRQQQLGRMADFLPSVTFIVFDL